MADDLAARVSNALAKAENILANTSVEARVERALLLAKTVTMPLSTKPPAPAQNAKKIRVMEISVSGVTSTKNPGTPLCKLCVRHHNAELQKRETALAIRPWTHEVKVLKGAAPSVAEERFVLGVVLEPETVDAQKDIYSAEEIRKAAHGFMEHHGHIGLMHKEMIDGRVKILESYVAPTDFIVEGQHIKKGTWLLAARIVDDKLWKSVKDGSFNGWSIGGTAVKEPDRQYSELLSLFGS